MLGIKFVATATPGTLEVEAFLQLVYELYSDYVIKNPFYEMDMPIRCDLFNKHLDKAMTKLTPQPGKRRA